MTTEKKFLSAAIYPTNKDIGRKWFIKYYEEDFIDGGLRGHKYYGMLNREPDLEKRLALAKSYLAMMQRGEPLPGCQGLKTTREIVYKKSNTNVITCCEKYLSSKELEGKRNSTIIDYRSKIKIFGEWLQTQSKQNLAIGAIDKETAMEFLLSIKQRGLSNSSFNDYRTLFGSIWHEYRDRIQRNPWREIKAARNTVEHLKSFPIELQIHILNTLPGFDKQLWIFSQWIYYTGIRPQAELRLLKVKDINFETGIAMVPKEISKNHKERAINVFAELVQQMVDEKYNSFPPDYYLFGHDNAPGEKRVGKNYFSNRWDDYRKAHNIPACYKLYGEKHTGGKALTKVTNAYITQQHFGHGDLKTTESYIDHLDKNELKFLQVDFPKFAAKT